MNTFAGATLRGSAAIQRVRELLDDLNVVDGDIETVVTACSPKIELSNLGVTITSAELKTILEARRGAIVNELENKGIHIRPDALLDQSAPEVLTVGNADDQTPF
jgi:hypothetical protein